VVANDNERSGSGAAGTAPPGSARTEPGATDLDSGAPRTAQITVLSGPTAVGKGTVVKRLRQLRPDVWVSVSVTTRPPRPGEQHGVHYLFVDEAEFDRLVADNALLEWAVVHGRHRYGTPRQPVLDAITAGRPALLELDLQGARQVRQNWPAARFVFLAPPSWDELIRRQAIRGTEDRAERERRLQTARDEMAAQDEFDHTIVNRDVDQAVQDLLDLLGL
jgi:guanylate kinase